MTLFDDHIVGMVERILREVPATRDDVLYLYERILGACGYSPGRTTILEIHELARAGDIPSVDTVSRYSRKVQKEHVDLRGNTYGLRKHKEQEVIRELRDKVAP